MDRCVDDEEVCEMIRGQVDVFTVGGKVVVFKSSFFHRKEFLRI